MKFRLTFIIICLFLLVAACNNKRSALITYKLKRSDFIEKIAAGGTVQAVNNLSIMTPRVNISIITVDHLAEEGTYVKKGDTICILAAPELRNQLESFNTDLETMEADMKKLEANNALEMSLLKAQIETNKAQVAISTLDSVQMKFANPVKKRLLGLEQEKVSIEKRKLEKKYAAQMRINNSEIVQMKNRIMIQKSRILILQNQVNSLFITAPQDGIVMHTESPTVMIMSSAGGSGTLGGKIEEGSSVFAGMSLLQLPDMRQMQVLIEVPEADFKRIETGQKVKIQVDAVKNLFTTGIIKRKNAAGKTTQYESQVKTYEVIASIDSCHLRMKPGLSARCEILIKEAKDTLVLPSAAIFGKDSSKIVYVSQGELFRIVPIKTGISNSTECILSSGLKGDETIALVEPPYSLIIKEKTNK
jgi:HlyD family secretion protein